MKVIFNNDADAKWFQWTGSREELEQYMATNEGFFKMVNFRARSPIIVHIICEDIYIDIWPGQEGVEFVPQDTSDRKLN